MWQDEEGFFLMMYRCHTHLRCRRPHRLCFAAKIGFYLILKLSQGNVSLPCSISHRFSFPLDQTVCSPMLLFYPKVLSSRTLNTSFWNSFLMTGGARWHSLLPASNSSWLKAFKKLTWNVGCTFYLSGSSNRYATGSTFLITSKGPSHFGISPQCLALLLTFFKIWSVNFNITLSPTWNLTSLLFQSAYCFIRWWEMLRLSWAWSTNSYLFLAKRLAAKLSV